MNLHPLFLPCEIAGLSLKNRFAMAPMTRGRSPHGIPSSDVATYYEKRARGGVALIISEGILVEHPLANAYGDIPFLKEDAIPAWQEINRRIHQADSKCFAQVWHTGPLARPGISKHSISENDVEVVRAASARDKEELIEIYSKAARVARQSDFDGLELHCAHGYLLDSFLRAGDDAYVCEIIRETRLQVGPDFPICLRFSTWQVGDFDANYISSPQQLEALLTPLSAAGVDIFHPSVRRFWQSPFPDDTLGLAGWTRKISGKPTITVGNIGLVTQEFAGLGPESLTALQERFDRGEFDLAAAGRPLLTDPVWVEKCASARFEHIQEFYPDAPKEVFP